MLQGMRLARAIAAAATIAFALALAHAAPARAAEQTAYAAAMNYATPTFTIGQGDTLTLNNLDTLAKHDLVGHDGEFGSDLIAGGESGPVRGTEKLPPAQYQFHCTLHGWMKGVMTVGPPGSGGVGAPSVQNGTGTGTGHSAPDPIDIWPQATPEQLGAGSWPFYGKDLSNSRDGGTGGPSPQEVPNLGPAWSFHSHHGDFTATPVIDTNVLVAGSNGGFVFGLNATTGKEIWQYDAGKPINGSAAIAGRTAYIPIAEPHAPKLLALDLKTGRKRWQRRISMQKDADVYGSPVVWNKTVYMGTSAEYGELNDPKVNTRGTVVALNARNGKLRWRAFAVPPGHDGGAIWTTPAIDTETGRLYVGTGNAYHDPAADTTDSVLALDAGSGAMLAHYQVQNGDVWEMNMPFTGPDADFGASPNLFTAPDGRKLVGEGNKNGNYYALDPATWKPVWRTNIGPGSAIG